MCYEGNKPVALLRNERGDDQFKLEGAAIYEGCQRAAVAEGTVYSEADWTIAWPLGGAWRLVLQEVGSDSQAEWLELRLVRSCRTL